MIGLFERVVVWVQGVVQTQSISKMRGEFQVSCVVVKSVLGEVQIRDSSSSGSCSGSCSISEW